MAEPAPTAFPPVRLCASADLAEKGLAYVFDVLQWREPMRAFVLRFEGRVVGYLNRCVHVPSEMDWQPGEFLDSRQEFILCATHGAAYEPLSGRCVAGPCGRGRLTMLRIEERDGDVYWYPSPDTRPVFDGALPSTDERTP
ncbi:MAG TPA: Rieske 2Fe-2S domain-containing protein [Burkholderiaceae bacterium]|nr:Rieske 2Fe-2S domain-containing protein [Burkholderiaceae bacterium]